MAKYTEHKEWIYGKHEEIKGILGKEIWGCAYEKNYSEKSNRFICKPVKGVILQYGDGLAHRMTNNWVFYEFNKNNKLKKNGVRYHSRVYADTYEECVELYNEYVQKQAVLMQQLLDNVKEDFIKI